MKDFIMLGKEEFKRNEERKKGKRNNEVMLLIERITSG
jgi:hypothetical protein